MKYTKYLIDGDYVDLDSMQTENKILKAPVIMVSIVVAVAGVATISSMLPFAFVVDELRNTKCRIIHFKRHRYKIILKDTTINCNIFDLITYNQLKRHYDKYLHVNLFP